MNKITLLFSASVFCLIASKAYAVDRTWDAGAGTTNWFTAQNWSTDTVPTTSDRTIVNLASGVTIVSGAAVSNEVRLGSTSGGTGNLAISAGGTLTSSGVGGVGFFSGVVSPFSSGGSGTATITGIGSQWSLGSNALTIAAGTNSTGTLNIQSGGAVSNANSLVGNSAGSTGTVVVTGTGSAWTSTGTLRIGLSGSGNLSVQNNAAVTATQLILGVNSTGVGVVNISSGGSLVATTADANIGSAANGLGTVTVTGTNSKLDIGSRTLNVGLSGGGTLTVSNGALVTSASGTIANFSGSSGSATVTGVNSSWATTGALRVGQAGSGTLNVQNSAIVTANQLFSGGNATGVGVVNILGGASLVASTGDATVGDVAGASGSVTITGLNSKLDMGVRTLYVGKNGTGNLALSDGGLVKSGLTILGNVSGSMGTATISGAGSNVSATGDLTVGSGGSGIINIQNGGRVDAGALVTLGVISSGTGTVTVSGSGSTLAGTSDLRIGRAGTGTLNIQSGGTVSNLTGTIGLLGGSTGTATITGIGSLWSNSGDIYVGSSGTGKLTVSGGAIVSSFTTHIAEFSGSSGVVNIGADAANAAAAPGTLQTDSVKFGAGTGTLNFNHTSSNYIFESDITGLGTINLMAGNTVLTGDLSGFTGTLNGAASLALSNGGTTILSTNSSSFSGVTTVENGSTLTVNGSLGGTTIVNDGRLMGNGGVNSLTFNTGSEVAPGNSIGTINTANVTFNPGSTYEVEVNSAAQSDRINASGTATLNGGTVLAIPFPDFQVSQPYTILTAAGGITGTFEKSTDDYLLLDTALSYDANNVYLTLSRNGTAFTDIARTANQRAVAKALAALPLDDLALDGLYQSSDANLSRQALDALSGEVHAHIHTALLQEQALLRNAVAQPAQIQVGGGNNRIWASGFGSVGSRGSDGNAAGTDQRSAGTLIGIGWQGDGEDAWQYEIAAGQSRTSLDIDDRASKAISDNYHLIAHTSGGLPGDLSLNAGVSYTFHEIETDRAVNLPGLSITPTAEYHGNTTQAFANLGKAFGNNFTTVEPFVSAAIMRLHTDNFAEDGVAGLKGASSNDIAATTMLGFRGSRIFDYSTARLSVAWQRSYGDDHHAELAFEGSPASAFEVHGTPLESDAIALGGSLETSLASGFSLLLRYNGTLSQDGQDHSLGGNLTVAF